MIEKLKCTLENETIVPQHTAALCVCVCVSQCIKESNPLSSTPDWRKTVESDPEHFYIHNYEFSGHCLSHLPACLLCTRYCKQKNKKKCSVNSSFLPSSLILICSPYLLLYVHMNGFVENGAFCAIRTVQRTNTNITLFWSPRVACYFVSDWVVNGDTVACTNINVYLQYNFKAALISIFILTIDQMCNVNDTSSCIIDWIWPTVYCMFVGEYPRQVYRICCHMVNIVKQLRFG